MAASSTKMKRKRNTLLFEDCKCPICLYILIEPVTMPCTHELCMRCFKRHVNEVTFTCPICRLRISNWTRQCVRENTLVNRIKWKSIQNAFPFEVKRCLELFKRMDEYPDFKETLSDCLSPKKLQQGIPVDEPGEIRKEYIEFMESAEKEHFEERLLIEKKNEDYILSQISDEEQRQQLARLLALRSNEGRKSNPSDASGSSINCPESSLDLSVDAVDSSFVVVRENVRKQSSTGISDRSHPTTTQVSCLPPIRSGVVSSTRHHALRQHHQHLSSNPHLAEIDRVVCNLQRSTSNSSIDSITPELQVFKPIHTSPRTPPKKQSSDVTSADPVASGGGDQSCHQHQATLFSHNERNAAGTTCSSFSCLAPAQSQGASYLPYPPLIRALPRCSWPDNGTGGGDTSSESSFASSCSSSFSAGQPAVHNKRAFPKPSRYQTRSSTRQSPRSGSALFKEPSARSLPRAFSPIVGRSGGTKRKQVTDEKENQLDLPDMKRLCLAAIPSQQGLAECSRSTVADGDGETLRLVADGNTCSFVDYTLFVNQKPGDELEFLTIEAYKDFLLKRQQQEQLDRKFAHKIQKSLDKKSTEICTGTSNAVQRDQSEERTYSLRQRKSIKSN